MRKPSVNQYTQGRATFAHLSEKHQLTRWLEEIQHRVRPQTLEGYESLTRFHLSPALGHIKLVKLSPEVIRKAWSGMLGSGKSAAVLEHCHLRLSKAEAVQRLWEEAMNTEYYEAIHTPFHTGLRRGEVLALRWCDVDLDMATASVGRTVYRSKGGKSEFSEPKTAKGKRLVSLTSPSAPILRALRERQHADGILLGYQIDDGSPLFRYRSGSPKLPGAFSGAFTKIMRRGGLEAYRLHDARHAHAGLMLKRGLHPEVVSQRLATPALA